MQASVMATTAFYKSVATTTSYRREFHASHTRPSKRRLTLTHTEAEEKVSSTNHPPPREVLDVLTYYLDPETMSNATCVCKLWSEIMSRDCIWKPLCSTNFPTFSYLRLSHPSMSYHRLYRLAYLSSESRKHRPSPPIISLNDLMFSVNVFKGTSHVLTQTKHVENLKQHNGVFRFDMEVYGNEAAEMSDEMMRVTWTVVYKDWRSVFSMMDCKGKGMFVRGEQWFSEELPSQGCCATSTTGNLVADIGLCSDAKKKKIDKVTVGLMNVTSLRYLSIDDALRYLECFLVKH